MVLRPPPFPTSIDELDVDVLSGALGATVAGYDAERIGADRGMLGEIFRIVPTYADGDDQGPSSIIAKFAALREGSLASARRAGTHERELRCYDELLADTPVAAPKTYGTWYDPLTAEFLLLQASVETDDTVDQIIGLDIDQAELVLREVARLHARWWLDERLARTRWLPRLDSEQRMHNLTTLARTGWEPMCELLGDDLTPAERALGPGFAGRLAGTLTQAAALPATLIHSDLRADNLLFAPDGSAVTLIDWQGVGVGPPGFDLAYFLSQSLTVDGRRAHEEELLSYYRSELSRAGLDLTDDEIRAGYAESMQFGLVIACALPLISDRDEPRVRRLATTVARRSIEALRDHGQLWIEEAT